MARAMRVFFWLLFLWGACPRRFVGAGHARPARYKQTAAAGQFPPHPALRGHLPPRGKAFGGLWGGVLTPPRLPLNAANHPPVRRGGIYAARAFPASVICRATAAGRRGRRPPTEANRERHMAARSRRGGGTPPYGLAISGCPVGAGHARPGGFL